MEISFCEYLINIGFINKESFSNIILDYHKKYSNNNNFSESMNIILNYFLENITENEKNYMSLNLIQCYFDFIKNKKLSKLKEIYFLYKGILSKIKLKNLLRWKYITQFKNITIDSNVNNDIDNDNGNINKQRSNKKSNKPKKQKYRNDQNNNDKINYNFISMKINSNRYIDKFQTLFNSNTSTKKNFHISSQNESSAKKLESSKENTIKKHKKNVNELQTSLALKEQEELKECTFSPKINNFSKIKHSEKKNETEMSSKNNNRIILLEIFEKLHNDDVLYKNKIKKYQEKYEMKFREENTFKPKIYNNSFTRKYSKDNISFIQRQKSFLEKKKKNLEKVKKLMKKNFKKKY